MLPCNGVHVAGAGNGQSRPADVAESEDMFDEKKSSFVAGLNKTAPDGCPFRVGQLVDFTNDYGVTFRAMRILGFSDHGWPAEDKRIVHTDCSSYWFPKKVCQLAPSVETRAQYH